MAISTCSNHVPPLPGKQSPPRALSRVMRRAIGDEAEVSEKAAAAAREGTGHFHGSLLRPGLFPIRKKYIRENYALVLTQVSVLDEQARGQALQDLGIVDDNRGLVLDCLPNRLRAVRPVRSRPRSTPCLASGRCNAHSASLLPGSVCHHRSLGQAVANNSSCRETKGRKKTQNEKASRRSQRMCE